MVKWQQITVFETFTNLDKMSKASILHILNLLDPRKQKENTGRWFEQIPALDCCDCARILQQNLFWEKYEELTKWSCEGEWEKNCIIFYIDKTMSTERGIWDRLSKRQSFGQYFFLCYMLAGKSTQFTNSCWADSEQSFKKEAANCLSSLSDEGNCQTKHQTNGVVFLKQSCNFPSKSAILIQTHNGKRANVYCMWRWCHFSSDGYFESVA